MENNCTLGYLSSVSILFQVLTTLIIILYVTILAILELN